MSANLLQEKPTENAAPCVREAFEGRYMAIGASAEYACRTFEISPHHVALFAPLAAEPGDKIVLYLTTLGRLTGAVLRTTEIGFDMTLTLPQNKRERLAAQLEWYAARAATGVEDRRRHERIAPLVDLTMLRLPRGDEHIARVRSLSLSGAAIETDHHIPLGSEVTIGKTPARVIRILDDGVACEFLQHFRPGEIDETTRL